MFAPEIKVRSMYCVLYVYMYNTTVLTIATYRQFINNYIKSFCRTISFPYCLNPSFKNAIASEDITCRKRSK